jgi:chromate reductase
MRLLPISGSTRAGSSNSAALQALLDCAPPGSSGLIYSGLAELPAFNPDDDDDPLPPPVADLRDVIAAADGIVFCVPEYAGTLPGSFKNLLDWTVGGVEMAGKPVGWLNVAATGRGQAAIATLRTVLGYVGADIIGGACRDIPVGPDRSELADPAVRDRFRDVWTAFSSTGG